MENQSDCVRARLAEVEENTGVFPLVSVEWQEAVAALEARVLQTEDELKRYKEQVDLSVPVAEIPQVQASVSVIPTGAAEGEPWYGKLRSQYPPTFGGGLDQLKAKRWLALITSMLDYMEIEDHKRVTCAVELLEGDALIWWGVIAQLRYVHNMSWTTFQEMFGKRYFSEVFKEVTPTAVGSQRGVDPNVQKRKMLETTIDNDDKVTVDNLKGRQDQSAHWRKYPLCGKCRRRHHGGCRPRKCYRCGSSGHMVRDCPQPSQMESGKSSSVTLIYCVI